MISSPGSSKTLIFYRPLKRCKTITLTAEVIKGKSVGETSCNNSLNKSLLDGLHKLVMRYLHHLKVQFCPSEKLRGARLHMACECSQTPLAILPTINEETAGSFKSIRINILTTIVITVPMGSYRIAMHSCKQ
jgi:hypothetical protein